MGGPMPALITIRRHDHDAHVRQPARPPNLTDGTPVDRRGRKLEHNHVRLYRHDGVVPDGQLTTVCNAEADHLEIAHVLKRIERPVAHVEEYVSDRRPIIHQRFLPTPATRDF
jgi:hypothetical protein